MTFWLPSLCVNIPRTYYLTRLKTFLPIHLIFILTVCGQLTNADPEPLEPCSKIFRRSAPVLVYFLQFQSPLHPLSPHLHSNILLISKIISSGFSGINFQLLNYCFSFLFFCLILFFVRFGFNSHIGTGSLSAGEHLFRLTFFLYKICDYEDL